jgi:thiol:disulfide interchange protein DsbD
MGFCAAILTVLAAWLLEAGSARADFLGDLATPFRRALEGDSWAAAAGVSYMAGLATALTPCVYPMIAITVSVFGARQVKTRAEGALLSTAFVAGMAVLFTGLGTAAALTGGVFGDELASPWVAGALAVLFLALALSMFGAYELGLPSSVQTRLSEMGGLGYRGAFVLGMVSSLIAAPCVGPVLGLILPWVGTTGNVGLGALYMFSYALGLGTLFWVVGTFAVSLPKTGRWIEWTKSIFGLVMLASGLYFIRAWLPGYDHITADSSWLIYAGVAIVLGVAIGAVHLSFHGSTLDRGRKALGLFAASLGAMMLIGALEATPAGAHLEWRSDLSAARAEAKKRSVPLIVDFGADWCGACGELERETFSKPEVQKEMARFVRVKVDLSADGAGDKGYAWLEGYEAQGLPLVVMHDPRGKEVARITRFVEPAEMLAALRSAR